MTPCEICADQDATIGHLCRTHADHLHAVIARTPDRLHELELTITRQSEQVRGVTGGGDGHEAMPFHVGASTTRTRLEAHLTSAAAAAGWPTHGHTHIELALQALRGLAHVAAHPDIHDLYHALISADAEAERMIDIQETGIVVGECDCQPSGHDQPQLVVTPGDLVVHCPACDARWWVAELIAAREDRVNEARNMRVSEREAARLLNTMGYRVTYDGLHGRVKRGQLTNDGGVRLGDCMDVLTAAGKGPRHADKPLATEEAVTYAGS